LHLKIAANHKSQNLATHRAPHLLRIRYSFSLFKSITIIRITYGLKQTKSFHGQLLISKSLFVKMNKKSLMGGIYFKQFVPVMYQ